MHFPVAALQHSRVALPPPRVLPEANVGRLAAAMRGLPLACRPSATCPWRPAFGLAEVTGLRVPDLKWTTGSEGARVLGKEPERINLGGLDSATAGLHRNVGVASSSRTEEDGGISTDAE